MTGAVQSVAINWKQGHTFWEESKDAAQVCRDGIRKAQAKLQLTMAGDVKNRTMGFHRCIGQKIRLKKAYATHVPPPSPPPPAADK